LACPRRGTVTLTEQVASEVRRENRTVRRVTTVVLGTATYSVRAGHRVTVEVHLKSAGRSALAHAAGGRLAARLAVSVVHGLTLAKNITLMPAT